MKKTPNSLSKQTTINMDRKPTIKKYTELLPFPIYDRGIYLNKIQCLLTATVAELVDQAKQLIQSNCQDYIGLISRNNNQIIDYSLKMEKLQLSNFPKNIELSIQRMEEVFDTFQPALNDFEFLKLLGSGVSACVYLVRHKSNGLLYAMKQIKKSYFKQFKRIEQVLRERKIMIHLLIDVPFTTKLMASFESQKFLNFLLQYCPGGEMFLHLQRKKLTQDQAKLYVAEMVLTFQQLHSKRIIYRDLKPENIMIDFDGHAKLGDFGLCKINLEYYDLTYSYCGSEQYMAPQVKNQSGYNYSVDFYTLGSFAYELVMGVPPFFNNEPLCFRQDATDEYIELVTKLIEPNMHRRLKSFNQIKKLKWFRFIEWKKVIEKKYVMPYKLDLSLNYIGDEFKNEIIDPQICEESKFDRLLQCFFYLNEDPAGISQFYRQKKKEKEEKSGQIFKKTKNFNVSSLEKTSQKLTRKSSKSISVSNLQKHSKQKNALNKAPKANLNIYTSTQSNTNSQSRSINNSQKIISKQKQKNTSNKNPKAVVNIYTSINQQEKEKKKNVSSGSKNSKNRKKSDESNNKTSVIKSPSHFCITKKKQLIKEKPSNIRMKNVKSNDNLLGANTFYKFTQMKDVYSPKKLTFTNRQLK